MLKIGFGACRELLKGFRDLGFRVAVKFKARTIQPGWNPARP